MTRTGRAVRRTLAAALAVVTVAACGSAKSGSTQSEDPSTGPTTAHAGEEAGDGDWLLRFTTAEGDDGEQSRAVLVSFNPTTGAARTRTLPATTAGDAGPDEQVLLVSADHAWALPDTGVPHAQARTGKLVLYAVGSDATQTLDIQSATGRPGLRATAWAFDPADASVLRVVDADLGVWKVDVNAMTATQEATLPTRSGWIYANGFDKTTGEPYIESIDSDQTEPAGNGDSDVRPVVRQGGTLIRYAGGEAPAGLPKPPCGFAAGFAFEGGIAWLFCADTPSIAAYQAHPDGASWHGFGRPSPEVVPATAAELSFVLPPVG